MPAFSIGIPTDGQGVSIEEIGLPNRIVRLWGRNRPEQPVTVAAEQRSIQTHYPGTQRASVQVMGTKEDPVQLRGWFQDPLEELAGNGPRTQEALLRGIMQSGGLCRLIWGTVIVKQGRVKRVSFDYHRANRVKYEITFEVDQADEAVALLPIPNVGAAQAALAAALSAAVAAAKIAVTAVRTVKILTGVVR